MLALQGGIEIMTSNWWELNGYCEQLLVNNNVISEKVLIKQVGLMTGLSLCPQCPLS